MSNQIVSNVIIQIGPDNFKPDEVEVDTDIIVHPVINPNSSTSEQNKFRVYEIYTNESTCCSHMKLYSVKDLYNVLASELTTKNCLIDCGELHIRDLRRLDYKLNPKEEAAILVRKHIVIFSVDTTRAIITSDKLRFIVPDGADSMLDTLIKHMNIWDQTKYPFETHAYDGLFLATKFIDETNLNVLKTSAANISVQLKKKSSFPLKLQENLKNLKNKLTERSQHFDHIKQALNDIMDDDEKMSLMNLTEIKKCSHLPEFIQNHSMHERIESLLEVHLYDFNGLSSEIDLLTGTIKHAEEFALFRLSSIRNQLMIVNTVLSILTCAIGLCAYITGLFGMNLDNVNTLQPISGVFNNVVISTVIFVPIATFCAIIFLKKYDYLPV